jgi:hypothetical protein
MTARFGAVSAAVTVAILLGACGQSYDDLVTGTFSGGKLIALNHWVGTNTPSWSLNVDAYADVPDQTPGILDFNGPQHWRCDGRLLTPSYVPSTGGPFPSDKDRMRDRVVKLPSMSRTFTGSPGRYRITIELPSLSVKFGHTWELPFPESPLGVLQLYRLGAGCTQIVESLLLQKSLADQYLSRLQGLLDRENGDPATFISPSPIRNELQSLLDQARQAKLSGDGRADPAARTADYQSSATILTKMARSAGDFVPAPNAPWLLAPATRGNIIDMATEAAALLSQTGLT